MRENAENINRLQKDFRISKWILSEHVFFIDVNFSDWISPFWYVHVCDEEQSLNGIYVLQHDIQLTFGMQIAFKFHPNDV